MSSFSIQDLEKRKHEILLKSTGIDYSQYEDEGIGFSYENLMKYTGYDIKTVQSIQKELNVGGTPLIELKNITKYARKFAEKGKGARIFLKDEAQNLSGSFKARRAAVSVYAAKKQGFKGVIAATSGNYGAAVAALAAKVGLKCIIVQECFDSKNKAQPEIIEKARACEAYGAEVIQLSVGPELFYTFLHLLDETGYFNASLYSPHSIQGIETLGYEIATEIYKETNRRPSAVIVTNAGGGNLTGTARGYYKAFSGTKFIAASVNLKGLHMASDEDFNRKSFTTGHTGFGFPFTINPDRSDVPRSAARPLRYMDSYYTVNQGSVFFITEVLAALEGLERGPAGNTSLAVAFRLAQKMDKDEVIVVQESEYTGAGKHHQAQLSFAKKNGVEVKFGKPEQEIPGKSIIIPTSGKEVSIEEIPMNNLRKSYLKPYKNKRFTTLEYIYLLDELKLSKKSEIDDLMQEVNNENQGR